MMQANQLYVHERTGKIYRVLIPWVSGKGTDNEWQEGVVYVGCYDGITRWTIAGRFIANFRPANGAEKAKVGGVQ